MVKINISTIKLKGSLTLEKESWFFLVTCHLDMLNTCAILFFKFFYAWGNYSLGKKHVKKHWNCKCDPDLWDRGMVLSRNRTGHLQDMPLVLNYFKILPCILTDWTHLHLNCLCDLDLWERGVVLLRDKLSWNGKHFYQVIWKSIHAVQSYGPDAKNPDAQMDRRTDGQTSEKV